MKAFNSFTRWIECSLESSLNAISNRLNNNWKGNKESKTKSPKLSKSKILTALAPFEEYFSSVQSILIWENPLISATALIALNCIYWYVLIRFYFDKIFTYYIIKWSKATRLLNSKILLHSIHHLINFIYSQLLDQLHMARNKR